MVAGHIRARRARRAIGLTTGLTVLVMVIELTATIVGGLAGIGSVRLAVFPSSSPKVASPPGSAELSAAEGSLGSGGGPAFGAKWDCSTRAGVGEAACGPGPASATPAAAFGPSIPTPSWVAHPVQVPDRWCCGMMVYDAADGYDLLFGGWVDPFSGSAEQTWTFAAGHWTELHLVTSPPSRIEGMMAYDTADRYVVMYGGYNVTRTPIHFYNDTWSFVAGRWTQLHPHTNPGILIGAGLAYDANDSYVLLFGGENSKFNFTGSTWEFKAGSWLHLTPATAPGPRGFPQMAYDGADGWILLFGGGNRTKAFGDTWTFSAGKWTRLAPASSPGPREAGAMAYSPMDDATILFGGSQVLSGNMNYSDTWQFAHGTWTRDTPAFSPSSRITVQFADGTASTPVVLFGGSHYPFGTDLNDTWSFHASVWSRVVAHVPAARAEAVMTYDEADRYVVLFGGESYSGVTGDTWTYAHGTWTNLHPSVAPSPRTSASMAYDQADGYVVLFGGAAGLSGGHSDTWTFLAGVWTDLSTQVGGPPGRYQAALAYDAMDGYLLLFGGYNVSLGFLDDTWSFAGGTWTNESGGAAPSPRSLASMTYDSGDGYILLFGGYNGQPTSDTWSYVGGSWTNLTSTLTVSPPATYAGGMAWDSTDLYVLLFGGGLANGTSASATWSFANGSWSLLHPAVHPVGLNSPALAYDARDSYIVLFGGFTTSAEVSPMTWTYS